MEEVLFLEDFLNNLVYSMFGTTVFRLYFAHSVVYLTVHLPRSYDYCVVTLLSNGLHIFIEFKMMKGSLLLPHVYDVCFR